MMYINTFILYIYNITEVAIRKSCETIKLNPQSSRLHGEILCILYYIRFWSSTERKIRDEKIPPPCTSKILITVYTLILYVFDRYNVRLCVQ